ncbi:hypothetical protein N431DRAFT_498403 [Stipitochalara longipes BDJ]|nr:hypothetical protein N431DRAFT_498403 [Stipitochalara longipes BDJ]
MIENPTWWPKPRYAHCCALSNVLHEQCGHVKRKLQHNHFHNRVTSPPNQWRDVPSVEALQELREAHESCPCLKTLYLLQRGQCSKCDYYQQVPPKPRSVLDRPAGRRDVTLADRLDHSQLLSPKRREQREESLKRWRHKIGKQAIHHQGFLRRMSRTELYSEMLSPIENQRRAAKCCSCKGYLDRYTDRYNDELMKMPCGHTMHHPCFKGLFYSSLRSDRLQCPACRRKYKVMMTPKFAVIK